MPVLGIGVVPCEVSGLLSIGGDMQCIRGSAGKRRGPAAVTGSVP